MSLRNSIYVDGRSNRAICSRSAVSTDEGVHATNRSRHKEVIFKLGLAYRGGWVTIVGEEEVVQGWLDSRRS